MAFCAWCGNHVTEVSYAACPRCGNPTNGSQRVAGADSSKGAGILIGLVIGGIVLVAVLGIFAAIAIPNLMTALQRSKQKRTMADLRTVATALESYAVDENEYPKASSVDELSGALVPKYVKAVPTVDGWGTKLRYECWSEGEGECTKYAFGSAGADLTFEHESLQEYGPDTKTTEFNNDVIFANGVFVQYPEGVQH